ncbi:Cyclic peptide export ABC transporter [Gammaproteobacteria bacterium]
MKKLINFYLNESNAPKGKIWFMASISGISNAILLAIINFAATQISNKALEERFFVMYLVGLLLFIYAQRYALTQATVAVEELIKKIRLRLVNKIRNVELRFIESHDPAIFYRPITEDSNAISFAALVLVIGSQSVVMLIAVIIYLSYLSIISLFVCIISTTVALTIYAEHHKKVRLKLESAYRKETEVFSAISSVLNGFKELKVNRRKSDALFQYIGNASEEYRKLKVDANMRLIFDSMFSQISFYSLLVVLVFIVPMFDESQASNVFKISATIFFIMGPINGLVNAFPMLAKVNVTIQEIYTLEARLDEMEKNHREVNPPGKVEPIPLDAKIDFRDVTFSYLDDNRRVLFSVGPFSLTLRKGEIVFIIGGNGSGKSTLLKLLCGLYYPDGGDIAIDDQRIDEFNYQRYREIFSIIFSDFYLFDRLYGLENVDEKRVNELLRLMELEKKTKYIDGRFTSRDLSTGQRKRLAFIVAVLENRPVCVFDELAADQDPQFRKNFYQKILPQLRQEGRIIVAATHDDKYFYCADRVLKMDVGKLAPYDVHASDAALGHPELGI